MQSLQVGNIPTTSLVFPCYCPALCEQRIDSGSDSKMTYLDTPTRRKPNLEPSFPSRYKLEIFPFLLEINLFFSLGNHIFDCSLCWRQSILTLLLGMGLYINLWIGSWSYFSFTFLSRSTFSWSLSISSSFCFKMLGKKFQRGRNSHLLRHKMCILELELKFDEFFLDTSEL